MILPWFNRVLLFQWPSYRFACFRTLHRFADTLLRRFHSVRLASFIVRFLVGGRFALCTLGLASGDGSLWQVRCTEAGLILRVRLQCLKSGRFLSPRINLVAHAACVSPLVKYEHFRDGTIHRHGPRNNPCPGSNNRRFRVLVSTHRPVFLNRLTSVIQMQHRLCPDSPL